MITDKTKDEIAERAAEPIVEHLKLEAAIQTQEGFCRRRCGKVCESPCPEAQMMAVRLFALAWFGYVRLN